MMDLNHVSLIGRLTRDAEYKVLPSGQAVCNFSIAVNRRRKNGDSWEDEANYFDIVLWGKQADSLNRYLIKGKQIGVDGELRQDRWQQDGQNRSKVVISAINVQLLGGGPGQGGAGASGGGSYSGMQGGSYPQSGGGHSYGETSDMDGGARNTPSDHQFTDDIPF
ncbi:MAG: single-stranded DNA-binding protein [Spirochaetaceae bacterium]|jgi:single-strand DNA-binding protein|nr:single-stranded DNA-binding protein [Spirochaetaceae bacterium]